MIFINKVLLTLTNSSWIEWDRVEGTYLHIHFTNQESRSRKVPRKLDFINRRCLYYEKTSVVRETLIQLKMIHRFSEQAVKKVVTLLQACLLTFSNTLSDNDGRKRRLPVGLYGLESSTLLCLSKESHPWPILVKLSGNNEWKQHHLESWKVIDFMNVTLVIYFVENQKLFLRNSVTSGFRTEKNNLVIWQNTSFS